MRHAVHWWYGERNFNWQFVHVCCCISISYSNEEKLHYGTIICSLGVRYKFYCSNIVRTMLYEPSQVSLEVAILLASIQLPLSLLHSSLLDCPSIVHVVSYCKFKELDFDCVSFFAATLTILGSALSRRSLLKPPWDI